MKALFLDIDGVLQPRGRQTRFQHMAEVPAICAHLNETKKNGFDYVAYGGGTGAGPYDIAAVYFDWDEPSVERLRHILDETGARLVISSDWREGGWERMKGLLAIHDLDGYLYGMTYGIVRKSTADWEARAKEENEWRKIYKQLSDRFSQLYPADPNKWWDFFDSRAAEIREYLDRHPEITAFVAIDDRNLEKGLNGHFVRTENSITEENMQQCIEILSREDGPYPLKEGMHTPELEQWREAYAQNYDKLCS